MASDWPKLRFPNTRPAQRQSSLEIYLSTRKRSPTNSESCLSLPSCPKDTACPVKHTREHCFGGEAEAEVEAEAEAEDENEDLLKSDVGWGRDWRRPLVRIDLCSDLDKAKVRYFLLR